MKRLFSKGILLSAFVLSLASCKKDYSATTAAPPAPGSVNEIGLATSATLGNYLVNNQGQALYMFAADADGTSSCTTCSATWPPVITDITNLKLDAGLSAADFATTNTAGKTQLTYKGWPLYSFSPLKSDAYGNGVNTPEAAGATAGDGVDGFRFIAKPDYTIMLANKQLTGQDGINYKGDYTVGIASTTYFTDGSGKTLYTFAQDKFNTNTFTLPDFSNNDAFPIYQEDQIIVPSVIDKTLFGKIIFANKKQFTYKGWPLYFLGGDTKRGSNKGISVPQVAAWPVAVKDIVQPVNP
jgi:predicted lipoprotein with Yx(FWY)xxD motif